MSKASQRAGVKQGPKWIRCSFAEARDIARKIGFTSAEDYRRRHRINPHLPAAPQDVFSEFKGWDDYLGVKGRRYTPASERLSFEEAKRVVREHGIETLRQFRKWDRPEGMPANPHHTYPEWKGWGDFLGTGNTHGTNQYGNPKTSGTL
jgi:hypothetical protein